MLNFEQLFNQKLGDELEEKPEMGEIVGPIEDGREVHKQYRFEDGTLIEIYSEGTGEEDWVNINIYYDDSNRDTMERARNTLRSIKAGEPVSEFDDSFKGLDSESPIDWSWGETYETAEPMVGIVDELKQRFSEENIELKDIDDDLNAPQTEVEVDWEDGEPYLVEATLEITEKEDEEERSTELHITTQKSRNAAIRFIVDPEDFESKPLADEVYEMIDSRYRDLEDDDEDEEEFDPDEFLRESDTSFEDIGGLEDVKKQLKKDVILPLSEPEKLEAAGVELSSGILLHGPPGTGKTYTARAVSNEADANFYKIDSEILDKYVGETEENLRQVVEKAAEESPSIVFIDELDGLVSRRDQSDKQHEESKTGTLLQLMDGFDERTDVAFVAATNNIDGIDPALLRSGRLGKKIEVPEPDAETRRKILEKKIDEKERKGAEFDEALEYDELVTESEGFTGADIDSWIREAVSLATFPQEIIELEEELDLEPEEVSYRHFEEALTNLELEEEEDGNFPWYQ